MSMSVFPMCCDPNAYISGETKRMSYLLELEFHMMEPLCRCQELNLAYLEAISPHLVI